MTSATYLARFFEEKNLADRTYEVAASDGTMHLIPTACVIEAIHHAPTGEQDKIAGIIRQLDFRNGDIHHFLNHLAGALAARY